METISVGLKSLLCIFPMHEELISLFPFKCCHARPRLLLTNVVMYMWFRTCCRVWVSILSLELFKPPTDISGTRIKPIPVWSCPYGRQTLSSPFSLRPADPSSHPAMMRSVNKHSFYILSTVFLRHRSTSVPNRTLFARKSGPWYLCTPIVESHVFHVIVHFCVSISVVRSYSLL